MKVCDKHDISFNGSCPACTWVTKYINDMEAATQLLEEKQDELREVRHSFDWANHEIERLGGDPNNIGPDKPEEKEHAVDFEAIKEAFLSGYSQGNHAAVESQGFHLDEAADEYMEEMNKPKDSAGGSV